MIGEGDCGEIGRMKIGSGNRNTGKKPAPAPLYFTISIPKCQEVSNKSIVFNNFILELLCFKYAT
jgi:hypothetical protein